MALSTGNRAVLRVCRLVIASEALLGDLLASTGTGGIARFSGAGLRAKLLPLIEGFKRSPTLYTQADTSHDHFFLDVMLFGDAVSPRFRAPKVGVSVWQL